MFKILIWGTGYGYDQYINVLKYQEMIKEIEIVGITGKDKLYDKLDGYSFIPLNEIDRIQVDYIVVTSDISFFEISKTAEKLGYLKTAVIKAKVFALPDFVFSDYVTLLKSKISIVANNCWGGTVYHSLGMRFYSPFINMFVNDKDYIRLLNELQYYLGCRLKYVKMGFDSNLHVEYPVCKLGDLELHFNHYRNMSDVENKWYERVERINWNNLFIMMYTQEKNIAEEFDKLNYEKKICFVPFPAPLKSAYYLQITNRKPMKNIPFWHIVNKTASGHYHDYNLVDLLNKGKVENSRQDLIKSC